MLSVEEVLKVQRRLQERMGHPYGHGEPAIIENLIRCGMEVTEAINELNFKKERKVKKIVDRQKFLTELTDALQFWANAVNEGGFTAKEVEDALCAKWVINHQNIDDGIFND